MFKSCCRLHARKHPVPLLPHDVSFKVKKRLSICWHIFIKSEIYNVLKTWITWYLTQSLEYHWLVRSMIRVLASGKQDFKPICRITYRNLPRIAWRTTHNHQPIIDFTGFLHQFLVVEKKAIQKRSLEMKTRFYRALYSRVKPMEALNDIIWHKGVPWNLHLEVRRDQATWGCAQNLAEPFGRQHCTGSQSDIKMRSPTQNQHTSEIKFRWKFMKMAQRVWKLLTIPTKKGWCCRTMAWCVCLEHRIRPQWDCTNIPS